MLARPGFRILLLLLLAMIATIIGDRVTKHVAATTLAGAPARTYLGDTFRLEYAENEGAFLGLGAEWPAPARIAIFSLGNGVLLIALAVLTMRLHWPPSALIGLALCVAGGLSNLADRLVYGKVIDFMNAGVGPIRTGIFNVADVAISVGTVVVVFVTTRRS
jgi:signal peptidase II